MSFIGEQIKKYRNMKGMTQQDIADSLGESSGRVIYNWEKGIGRPDCDKLAKLCDLLGVSADELIGCKSMAQRPTATEWTMLQKYRALDEHGKEVVDYLIDSEYKRVTALTRKPKPRMLKIDWFTLPASAGTGNILDSELAEELLVPESAEAEQADFVISVGGDSMEPTYHDGDKVFVEKCDSVDVGEVGIFVVNGDVYIKELGNQCLISHNEKYKPIRIGENDSVYCCGRVIGVVSE
ncbi:MAG: XRE family transcriptional regulator [Clostridia bacterium]|nr:XRE family transcriptional regulator [Clostridia bacterium]